MNKYLVCKEFGWTLDEYSQADAMELEEMMAVASGYKEGLRLHAEHQALVAKTRGA